jgi:hypothetical protein
MPGETVETFTHDCIDGHVTGTSRLNHHPDGLPHKASYVAGSLLTSSLQLLIYSSSLT